MAKSLESSEETLRVAGADLMLIKSGSGKPLLVLHEELGFSGWYEWQQELARERTLVIPLHPGFGRTPRLEWLESVRDLACFYGSMLREQSLAPIDVIGFSLGGWVAAEMAVSNPAQFRKMVLVGAAGIRPPRGEIFDMYEVDLGAYLRASVKNFSANQEFAALYRDYTSVERAGEVEEARTQTARMAWKPYMYNPSLPHLLRGVGALPAMLVWGSDDQIVPLSSGEAYNAAIRESQLTLISGAGHRPEIEKPRDFVAQVSRFIR